MAKNIKTRADDYAQWYLDVIKAARARGLFAGARLHGDPAGRVCDLGGDSAQPRPHSRIPGTSTPIFRC